MRFSTWLRIFYLSLAIGIIVAQADQGLALPLQSGRPTAEKKVEDYLILDDQSITLKQHEDRYAGQLRLRAGPAVKRPITFKAFLFIGSDQVPCDLSPDKLSSKAEAITSVSVPASRIPDGTPLADAKLRFHLTTRTATLDLTNLYSTDLAVRVEPEDVSDSGAWYEYLPAAFANTLSAMADWLKLSWPLLILVAMALRIALKARQTARQLRAELEEMRLKNAYPKHVRGDMVRELFAELETEVLTGVNQKINALEQRISQLQQSPDAGDHPLGEALQDQKKKPLAWRQDLIRTYNQYTPERRKEWEYSLRTNYGDRFARVQIGAMSTRGVSLEKQTYGNFLLISVGDGAGETCILPVPWLRFDTPARIELLKPFYNLPGPASDGRIEELEHPAQVMPATDGLWKISEQGKIRFRDRFAPALAPDARSAATAKEPVAALPVSLEETNGAESAQTDAEADLSDIPDELWDEVTKLYNEKFTGVTEWSEQIKKEFVQHFVSDLCRVSIVTVTPEAGRLENSHPTWITVHEDNAGDFISIADKRARDGILLPTPGTMNPANRPGLEALKVCYQEPEALNGRPAQIQRPARLRRLENGAWQVIEKGAIQARAFR
jgi:hypothetical protein